MAIEHLHQLSPPMIHRDVKLENFLFARDGSIKLCDFGSATTTVVEPQVRKKKKKKKTKKNKMIKKNK
jgi:cyclin G-associated kinase